MSNIKHLPLFKVAGQVESTPMIHAIFKRDGVFHTACGVSGKDQFVGQYLSITLQEAMAGLGDHPFCEDCKKAMGK